MRGKHKSRFFLGFILLFILIMGFIPSRYVFAQADIEYTFEQDVLFESDNPTIEQTFNMRSVSEFTEIYNATFSFENEVDGTTNSDIDFIDSYDEFDNTVITVINNYDGHSKVINCSDDNASGNWEIINNFNPTIQNFGTIEFWIQVENVDNRVRFRFQRDSTVVFTYLLYQGNHQIESEGNIVIALINTWYHIRIDYEGTTGAYQGLAQYDMRIYINGTSYGDFDYQSDESYVDKIKISSSFPSTTDTFLDSFGYSWDKGFDFESDIIGNPPQGWVPFPNPPLISTTVENAFGSQVLQLDDSDIVGLCDIRNFFSQEINQIIEFDIAVNTTTEIRSFDIKLRDGGIAGDLIIDLRIDNDDLTYYDGSWNSLKDDFIVVDTVFKLKIALNDDDNTYDVYIDGILEGNDLSYIIPSTISIDFLGLTTGFESFSIVYIDNFTFSSTIPYYTGLNLVPFIIVSETLQEVDRFEFAYDGKAAPGVLYDVGEDNVGRWVDREEGGGDKVNIQFKPNEPKDRVIEMIDDQQTTGRGIEYDDINNPSTDFLEVSLGITYDDINGGVQASSNLYINSFDDTVVMAITVLANGSLRYNDGVGGWVTLRDDITTDVFYEFDFFIDYNIDLVRFRYSVDGAIIEIYHFPLMVTNKFGINQVRFEQGQQIAVLNAWRLDYIGIYVNGSSISDEQGIHLINIGNPTWNFEINNLVNITAEGSFALGAVEARADPELWLNTSYQPIFELQVFDEANETRLENIYDNFVGILNDPLLMVSITTNISISHIDISGAKLTLGSNDFPLVYTHSERTFPNLDFFFVDDNNRLQFQMTARFTEDLEFMQARFDIDDLSSDGRAVSFRSQINDNAVGNFRVNFTSISNIVQLPIFDTTTRFVLTQNRTIRDFIIIVSDNGDPLITGLTEGFVSEIKLLFSANIGVSIVSTALIDMMIPLIIILIPTIAISKVAGKISIIPLFFLFSLICVMTLIIPVWLFFIIAISTGVFASMGRSEGVQ